MRIRSVVPALCAVLMATTPTVADAEIVRHHDPLADVARSRVGSNTYVPAPGQVQGDIVSTRVNFARQAVWVRYRLQDLAMTGNGNFNLIGITSDRRDRSVEIDAFPGHWEGRAAVTNSRGEAVACPVAHWIDYDRNLVGLRVPRSCLGKATWVRVGVRVTVAGTTYAYVDDARSAGYSPMLHYGQRVHRQTPRSR